MMIIFYLLIILILFFALFSIFYIFYAQIWQKGAVFYPSKINDIKKMLELANVGKSDVVMDLGSGDGRILIEAVRRGARAIGYEIDPLLVINSRKNIKKLGMEKNISVYLKSFWLADFNQASVITLYLFPKYMDKLQKILENKLTHKIFLVSNDYQFPRKKYLKRNGNIYLYEFLSGH